MAHDLTGQVVKAEAHCSAVGTFADIWRGTMMTSNRGRVVAAKVFRGPVDQTMRNRILREVKILNAMKHPNIVPLLGISLDFDGPQRPCLISPYYRYGDIIGFLKKHQNAEILPLITQVAGALSYLHNRSVVHGNIKGTNVLINDNFEAILTDFRRSRILGPIGSSITPELIPQSRPGEEEGFELTTEAWRWVAPELMSMDAKSIPLFTEATDVWGFSLTVIEIFSHRIPFSRIKVDASVILFVVSGGRHKREHFRQINDDVWCMLEKCWSLEPKQRPQMHSLFKFLMASRTAERAHM